MPDPSSPSPSLAQRVMEWSRPAIGVSVIALMGASFVFSVMDKNQDVLLMLVGSIVAQFAAVISYYFGSSSSSERKDGVIQNLASGPSTNGTGPSPPAAPVVPPPAPSGP